MSGCVFINDESLHVRYFEVYSMQCMYSMPIETKLTSQYFFSPPAILPGKKLVTSGISSVKSNAAL